MKNVSLLKKSILAASIAALTACSGGGGGTSTSSTDGTTSGVITGFGSVFVNGVEYQTDSATISIDDVSSIESQLSVGDVVTLQGTVDADGINGTAFSISSADELEGYVLDLSDLTADSTGTINIMGQTVSVSLDTVFRGDTPNSEITELTVNDIVEVHGFSDGTGTIAATRIETKTSADNVEVKGLISALDEANTTFTLGSLTVDYSSATELPATLVDGLYVEAATSDLLTGDLTTGFVMSASKVEIEEDGDMDVDGDEGEEIKAQGVVSEITDTSFLFNGSLVEFSSLEDGDDFDLGTLVDGMMITVEGYIDANGDFIVKEIAEDRVSEQEAKGMVDSTTNATITIIVDMQTNTTMTFSVNNSTRMMDDQDEQGLPERFFSLSDVAIGDYIEIEYSVDDTTGEKIATELTREDAPQMPGQGIQ